MSEEIQTRVIVCGGRDFADRELLQDALDDILPQYGRAEIVSGHAKGADLLAEEYARRRNISVKAFPAEWKRYGNAAGPIRNARMLSYAGEAAPAVIAFWDGSSPGTRNMIDQATRAGVRVHIIRY